MNGKISGNHPELNELQTTLHRARFRHSVGRAVEQLRRHKLRETAQEAIEDVNRERMRERANQIFERAPRRPHQDRVEIPDLCHAWEVKPDMNPFLQNLGSSFQF